MSDRSITINTVTAPQFQDCGKTLTPRMRLEVSYSEGGVNYMTYNKHPRGYTISVRHDRLSDEGWVSMIIDGKGNPTSMVEPAKRFSAKTLQKIADEVCNGKHDTLIEALYAKAKLNRSEYEWPTSILPKANLITNDGFADGGEAYTDDELQLA